MCGCGGPQVSGEFGGVDTSRRVKRELDVDERVYILGRLRVRNPSGQSVSVVSVSSLNRDNWHTH